MQQTVTTHSDSTDRPNRQIVLCPFAVVRDLRERGAPYLFQNMPPLARDRGKRLVVNCFEKHLVTGDYSIEGLESEVCVERKQLADLYGTLGKGRSRFQKEVERMADMQFSAVVIEADLREVWRPRDFHQTWQSRLQPRSVEGTMNAWAIRYPKTHWILAGSRRNGEIKTFGILSAFWKIKQDKKKEHERTNP
jgi:ERCC4-type nuclease